MLGGISNMDFSEFSKKFYINRNNISGIGNYERFIGALFCAGGSSHFPEKPSPKDYVPRDVTTQRQLVSGKKRLTQEMRDSFPYPINENKFVFYFKDRLGDESIARIMNKFGIASNIVRNKNLFLKVLCKQFQKIITATGVSTTDIVAEEYMCLLSEKPNPVDTTDTLEQSPISIWLHDAEQAIRDQSRFDNFTETSSVKEFLNRNNDYWGIVSVKGAGKTYLLQILRRDKAAKHEFMIIPYYEKLSRYNNWGTERVIFDNPGALENSDFDQLVGMWRAAILCLAINNVMNRSTGNKFLNSLLDEFKNRKNGLDEMFIYLLNENSNSRLHDIVNEILTYHNWHSIVQNNYALLRNLCKQTLGNRPEAEKIPIAIFIDKIDQSILQPGAEIPECDICYKITKYESCTNKNRDSDFCLKNCDNKDCCYYCEKFMSQHAGKEFRVYGSKFGKRFEHISRWQHLQLSLAVAVSQIQTDFESNIRVYYTIRQEALNAEPNLLGANANKILAHTQNLYYLENEQKEIYVKSIKNQHPSFLCKPELRNVEGMHDEAFVGLSKLPHPHVNGKSETIFQSIYRHSFDRAREIQLFGEAITNNLDKIRDKEVVSEREEEVKSIIETTAANLLFPSSESQASADRSYYYEKQILLSNYWSNPKNFVNFIEKVDRNLLLADDMAYICKNVNHCMDCDYKQCKEKGCTLHPFTMLYQLGLLGRASCNISNKADGIQHFLDSKDVTYLREDRLIFPGDDILFILHPALTKCIEINILKKSIKHFRKFILGKGLSAPNVILKELLKDKCEMDKSDFEKKYYVI